jgi:hypothetical protein
MEDIIKPINRTMKRYNSIYKYCAKTESLAKYFNNILNLFSVN